MSREIKFKVWDKEEKEMHGPHEIEYINFCDEFVTLKIVGFIEFEDTELLQYTGINDEENKEIYEGDIIEGGYLNPLSNKFMSKKYIVVYDKGSFVGKLIGHTPYGDTWLHFIKGKVIGNIYENPELLEVEDE